MLKIRIFLENKVFKRISTTFQEMIVPLRKRQKLQGYLNCFREISNALRKSGKRERNQVTIKEFKKVSGKSYKLQGI